MPRYEVFAVVSGKIFVGVVTGSAKIPVLQQREFRKIALEAAGKLNEVVVEDFEFEEIEDGEEADGAQEEGKES